MSVNLARWPSIHLRIGSWPRSSLPTSSRPPARWRPCTCVSPCQTSVARRV